MTGQNFELTLTKTIRRLNSGIKVFPQFMWQLCSKAVARVRNCMNQTQFPLLPSHSSSAANSTPLPFPSPFSISQQTTGIKARTINWNQPKSADHIKMKSHFSNLHVMKSSTLKEDGNYFTAKLNHWNTKQEVMLCDCVLKLNFWKRAVTPSGLNGICQKSYVK